VGSAKTATPVRQSQGIIIGHHQQDIEIARRLKSDLQAGGFTVWLDEDCLDDGHTWNQTLHIAAEARQFFVALLSKHSNHDELEKLEDDRALVLVHLDRLPTARLRDLRPIDLFPSYEKGLVILARRLSEPIRAVQQAPPPASIPRPRTLVQQPTQAAAVYTQTCPKCKIPMTRYHAPWLGELLFDDVSGHKCERCGYSVSDPNYYEEPLIG
jgi:hypothetical protein